MSKDTDFVIRDIDDFYQVMDISRSSKVTKLPSQIYEYVVIFKPDLDNYKDYFFNELTALKTLKNHALINECIVRGYMGILKYLFDKGYRCPNDSCSLAAANNQIKVLKFLHEHGYELNEHVCAFAAAVGSYECLKYARDNKCPWDDFTTRNSCLAFFGYIQTSEEEYLKCLKYAIEHECPIDYDKCLMCARNSKRMKLVKYLTDIKSNKD